MTRPNWSVSIICLLFLLPAASFADVILTGAGATFPYPLYKKWFDAYQAESDVRFAYRQLGSGGGIKQLMERTVAFGATDAFLSDQEEQQAASRILHIPTCVGAVAIIYNLPVYLDLRLTPDCIADIFLGRITKWSDKRIAESNARNMNLPFVAVRNRSGSFVKPTLESVSFISIPCAVAISRPPVKNATTVYLNRLCGMSRRKRIGSQR